MRRKLTARFVIGYDGGDHVVYRDGELVYEADRVLHVGHGFAGSVDRTIDFGDAIVSPGFIDLDALADIDHGVIDTFQSPELSKGLQWSEDYFLHRRHDVFSREDEAFQRRYALAQLLLNGITTAMPIGAETHKGWAETFEQWADVAEAAGDLGIRMFLGPAYRSGISVVRADGTPAVLWDEAEGEAGLKGAVDFIREYDGRFGGLLTGTLLPCRIETMSLELLRATKRWADELGCLIRIHAAQGAQEVAFLREWYDKGPIELLDSIGFLGPRVSSPHGRFVTPAELTRLAETGTTIIHCPLTSIRHGNVLESFERYRAAGVNVALGTDTFPPDMIRVMDLGSNLNKHADGHQSHGTAADFFRAATLDGAKALGRDDLGRLAPGAKADVTVVDLRPLRTGPIDDPIRTMLYNTNGSHVRHVVVDGRTVVEEGQIPGLDVESMRSRAQDWFERMKAAYAERDYRGRSADQLFPPSFKTLARGDA
jgi:cytosine/adenosine deaminase-related metal-dependent hydrolase